ncbi:MAG: HlyC/CorC family transporter [Proteobacteria bacterium]|nr:HlyC/CorC family transporter [Pseudomonadota bacterium]
MSDQAGEGDSRRERVWARLQRLAEWAPWRMRDQSLREQLEEAIADHEEEAGATPAAAGDLTPVERQMLRNLLHFSEHDADDVAIPRGAIVAVPASASWEELVAAFAEHGHSRLPVYRETLDEVIGMMLIKDVFAILASGKAPPKDWTQMMRQPLFVPQARGALDVLNDMRQARVHLAVVIDEYSGTDGIITIEDLVEEITGEIEDEHDEAPTDPLRQLDGGLWEADARAELEEVAARIDPRLAEVEEAVDTLGGLAFVLAGEVPEVGAILPHASGWHIEVIEGNTRHVTRLRLHPPLPEADRES